MRERRDYVVPYFNNKYRFDKPPWIYWMQVTSYRLFGENDFAARFPSGVAAALTAVLLFAWGRRAGGERVGWWAAIIFSLCFQTFVHARAAVADMWLVFFVTAAFWAGYELIADWLGASESAIDARSRKYWRLTFYVALALAFLAKGPLGWMPLLTVAGMKFFLRGQPLNRRFWFATGTLLTLVIVFAWGIPALVRTKGEFFWVGIGRHVVERSFGAMEGHGGQTWSSYFLTLPYYFATVFVSFFPWSIKLPALTKRLWRERDGLDRYLILGAAIIFTLMTIVKTKLPHYTLTAFPLLALLLARHLFSLPGSPRFATHPRAEFSDESAFRKVQAGSDVRDAFRDRRLRGTESGLVFSQPGPWLLLGAETRTCSEVHGVRGPEISHCPDGNGENVLPGNAAGLEDVHCARL